MTVSFRHCRIQITIPFLSLTAFLLLMDHTGVAVCGLFAALLHEVGHLAAMMICRRYPNFIRFTAFGAEIQTNSVVGSYGMDALVAVAGPIVNLTLWAITAAFMKTSAASNALQLFSLSNAFLGIFNLMPVEPLDGGQALLSFLSLFLSREKACRTVMICSFIVLVPMAILGFLVLFKSYWNVTLLLAVFYMIFLLLMKNGRYE